MYFELKFLNFSVLESDWRLLPFDQLTPVALMKYGTSLLYLRKRLYLVID